MNTYRADPRELPGALAMASTPAVLGSLGFWLMEAEQRTLSWLLLVPGLLISLHSLLVTACAFTDRIEIDARGVRTRGLIANQALLWSAIHDATLRERASGGRRPDRLLTLRGMKHDLAITTSILRREDEDALLARVREKVKLQVEQE